MASLDVALINDAITKGIVQGERLDYDRITFRRTVITSNRVFWAIKESGVNGLNLKQLISILDLNKSTLGVVLRVLKERDLIFQITDRDQSLIYYARSAIQASYMI